MGYAIDGFAAGESLEVFLPEFMANFDILNLLEVVERQFAPTTALPIRRIIRYRKGSQTLQILFQNTTTSEDEMVIFDRIFYWEGKELIVEH